MAKFDNDSISQHRNNLLGPANKAPVVPCPCQLVELDGVVAFSDSELVFAGSYAPFLRGAAPSLSFSALIASVSSIRGMGSQPGGSH